VHQVNYVLARSPNVAPEMAPKVKREALDGLIAQQLAVQEAIEAGLDRSPKVLQDMEAAKRDILTRAYRDRVVGDLQMPEASEVDDYYQANPELFAERRLFRIEEIAFAAAPEVAARVRNQVGNGRSMKQIADWLQAQNIRFAANQGVRAAEHVALGVLPTIQAMKPGDTSLVEAGDGRYQVVRLVASQPAPVDKATAAPRIRQFLMNEKARKAFAEEMKRLQDQAKIEYVGEFARGGAEGAPQAKPGAETKSKGFRYSWDEEPKPAPPAPSKGQGQQ
jgi:EpsD family peptidyl-prolyl cis-trans isomerase